jgi:hypothetical protein
MKILSLILSILTFFGAGYFLITDFSMSLELNNLIITSLLVILMLISVVNVLINYPLILLKRKKVTSIIYNSYSSKRIQNKEFDHQYGMI